MPPLHTCLAISEQVPRILETVEVSPRPNPSLETFEALRHTQGRLMNPDNAVGTLWNDCQKTSTGTKNYRPTITTRRPRLLCLHPFAFIVC